MNDVKDCYAALGAVHNLWSYLPGEFDDYIANPKDNDYQSLHTAVVGPDGKTVEVQIRSHEMHRQAELGVAAHWRYKEGRGSPAAFDQKIRFLRQLLEPDDGGEDLLAQIRDDVFEDRVYGISPKGDVVELPAHATPLDFAYHVHTQVGHRCRGAKVNGRIVPLTYEVKNGDHDRDHYRRSVAAESRLAKPETRLPGRSRQPRQSAQLVSPPGPGPTPAPGP